MYEQNSIPEQFGIEIREMGLDASTSLSFKEIRRKDGVMVYRIIGPEKSYVMKYFIDNRNRREIRDYSILEELGIPTIKVIGYTEKSILLEDINYSDIYRLGMPEDLCDEEVARLLAQWYRKLHDLGDEYLKRTGINLYRETDMLTYENMG